MPLLTIEDIATAFTIGFTVAPTKPVWSTWIEPYVIEGINNNDFPIILLISIESDPNDDELELVSDGNIRVIKPEIHVIADSDKDAVQIKLDWMFELYKTVSGNFGQQGDMPVDYNGLRFWRFEPNAGTVDEAATPLNFDNAGLFVSGEKLNIAFSKI